MKWCAAGPAVKAGEWQTVKRDHSDDDAGWSFIIGRFTGTYAGLQGGEEVHNAEMSHEYPDHTLRLRVQYALTLVREREPGSKMEAMAQEERIRDG
ncbi:hypothetical protein ABEX25_15605 [Paenibacillus thiaminolyticus]|uniref:hypothetical protein n=1 Tax=Paenibacillus thiaminolyticus TaxID=49283 RepID=UPI003D2B8585